MYRAVNFYFQQGGRSEILAEIKKPSGTGNPDRSWRHASTYSLPGL